MPASSPAPKRLDLEKITLIHVGVLLVFAAWAFGGNAPLPRNLIGVWGTLGLVVLVLNMRDLRNRPQPPSARLHWLWPLVAFNVLVVAGCLNPSFRRMSLEGDALFVANAINPWAPSAARPLLALHALWLFDGIFVSCFNLLLAVRRNQSLRALLLVLVANEALLAILGTLQKLVHAKGLYFGLQPSPQPRFFSSFIYANHWGAFAVLMLGCCLGLIFHYLRRHPGREFAESPGPLLLLAAVLIFLSLPLSGSRSGLLLGVVMVLVAFVHWLFNLRRLNRRHHHRRAAGGFRIAGVAVTLVAVAWVGFKLGKPVLMDRLADTRQQIARIDHGSQHDSRLTLYRDTWRMARARLLFGWGMASYPTVFYLYNSQLINPADGLMNYYDEAHNDWLQAVAELGLTGSTCIALLGVIPLWCRRRYIRRSHITKFLLGGCALVLLYALVELPFANTAVVIAFWTCFFSALAYVRPTEEPAG